MNKNFDKIILTSNNTVFEAIERLEATGFHIAFVVDDQYHLEGLITNGDLRRHLLSGGAASDSVLACMNSSYRSVNADASREEILKLFDLGFHVIPRLTKEGKLLDLITPDVDLATPEAPVFARARAPVRISFAGGGSDLTYFFVDSPGAVLSTTLALYSHATLMPRADKKIKIHSEDLATDEEFESLLELQQTRQKSLLSSVVSVVKPSYGLDLYVRSDFPVGSGLGGSSAVATAVVAAFNEMRLDRWNNYDIAELAFQAERLCFGVAGGWQDQYASVFGGLNLIELGNGKNFVHALRLEDATLNELEESLILCDSKIQHDSGSLHLKQRESFSQDQKTLAVEQMVCLCRRMHKHLIRGELMDFGRSLNEAWQIKRNLSPLISNQRIDAIYRGAINAGALGGKLMGAGGGGFFMFFVQPQCRKQVIQKLRELDCHISFFRFDANGVTSWRTKVH
ncbi:GHMP family kinase ATP-binding protein [Synechococcus sp. LTW-G]